MSQIVESGILQSGLFANLIEGMGQHTGVNWLESHAGKEKVVQM